MTAATPQLPARGLPLALGRLFSGWRLQSYVALRALVLGALFAALALWAVSSNLTDTQNNETGNLAAATAKVTAQVVDAGLLARTNDMQLMQAEIERQQLWREPARLRAYLESTQDVRPGYSWIGTTSTAGLVTVGTGGLAEGKEVAKGDWFVQGSTGLFHGDVHEALLLSAELPPLPGGESWRFVDIALPLRDAAQGAQGVLAAHLSWPWLRTQVQMATATMPHRGSLWIVGRDDRARLGEGDLSAALSLRSVQLARQGKSGWLIETWPDGRRYITGYAPNSGQGSFRGFGWITLVRAPADTWSAAAITQFQGFALAAIVAVLLMAVLSWAGASIWLRPLREFVDGVTRWRDGSAPPLPPTHGSRELHELSQGVVRLVEQLDAKERTVRHTLEEMQHSFRAVGRHLPGVLATVQLVDDEARFTFISDSAEHYFGVSPAEMLRDRLTWARHTDPRDVVPFREAFAALRDGRADVMTLPVRFTGRDGVVRTLRCMLVRRDDGAQRSFDWISLDISDLIAARGEAEAASRAKTDFLATMSHELRTPLNAILGFSRVLEDSLPDDEHKRQARFVRETGEVLTRILNDVLDLARADAGSFQLEPRVFELDALVDSVRAIYRVVALEKGLDFLIEVEPELPALVGDPIRLRQMLENLLSNALKFTARGSVLLRVGLERLDPHRSGPPTAHLRLEVVDTGLGIPHSHLDRVFERFEQGDRHIKMRHGGAGLGLAVVKTLAEKMGGHVRVHSQEGVGSHFTLSIPFPTVARREAPEETTAAVEPEPPLRILVADDLSLNRIVLRAQLEARGHTVLEAQDGVEALQQVRTQHVDVVLMDVDMPTLDGLQATRRLRHLEAAGQERRTPVYALTGKAFPEDVTLCHQAGMDGHLAKPIDVDDLVRVLRRVVPADSQRRRSA